MGSQSIEIGLLYHGVVIFLDSDGYYELLKWDNLSSLAY